MPIDTMNPEQMANVFRRSAELKNFRETDPEGYKAWRKQQNDRGIFGDFYGRSMDPDEGLLTILALGAMMAGAGALAGGGGGSAGGAGGGYNSFVKGLGGGGGGSAGGAATGGGTTGGILGSGTADYAALGADLASALGQAQGQAQAQLQPINIRPPQGQLTTGIQPTPLTQNNAPQVKMANEMAMMQAMQALGNINAQNRGLMGLGNNFLG